MRIVSEDNNGNAQLQRVLSPRASTSLAVNQTETKISSMGLSLLMRALRLKLPSSGRDWFRHFTGEECFFDKDSLSVVK